MIAEEKKPTHIPSKTGNHTDIEVDPITSFSGPRVQRRSERT